MFVCSFPRRTVLTTFVLLYQKSGQNLSIAGAVKNRKIFVNHQMSVTWIHKFSSTWIWRFRLNVNLRAIIVVFLILIVISSIFTVWLPRKTELNILVAFCLREDSHLKSDIKFSWLTYSFHSWLVNWILVRLDQIWEDKKSPGELVSLSW